jgi:formylglycine-generating enzyme required for sulfatase activity
MKFVEAGTPNILFSTLEIRRGEFELFVAETGHQSAGTIHYPSNGNWKSTEGNWKNPPGMELQSENHPVTCVSADDAEAFCEWLTTRERKLGRISADERYRLPSVTEWYAALGQPMTDISGGGVPIKRTATPLAARNEVPAEIADLTESVAEWTSTNGRQMGSRLLCGTSWLEIPPQAGTRTREYERNLRGTGIGFRIVLDQSSKKPNP